MLCCTQGLLSAFLLTFSVGVECAFASPDFSSSPPRLGGGEGRTPDMLFGESKNRILTLSTDTTSIRNLNCRTAFR